MYKIELVKESSKNPSNLHKIKICGDYNSIADSEVRDAIRVKGGTSFSVSFVAGLEGTRSCLPLRHS